MSPLDDELEILDRLDAANDSDRLAGAMRNLVFPRPGRLIAIDVNEIRLVELPPTGASSIDVRFWER